MLEGDLYCVLGAKEWPTLDAALRTAGFNWSGTIIWVKDSFVLGRSKYHKRYEPIWYGWRKKGRVRLPPAETRTTSGRSRDPSGAKSTRR